jgi:hypothetical protein
MANITIIFTDADGTGIPDQDIDLRKGPAFSVPAHVFGNVTGKPGAYKTPVQPATGVYRLYVNGIWDESYGEREITSQDDLIIKITDTSGTYFEGRGLEIRSIADPTEDQSATTKHFTEANYLKKAGDTMTGDLNMGGKFVKNLPAPEDDGDAARNVDVTDGDAAIADAFAAADAAIVGSVNTALADKASKTGDNLFQGDQVFEHDVNFAEDPPTCGNDPGSGNSLTRRDWVLARIGEVIVSPYQNSPNKLRLIPGGIQETNKVYTSWALCQSVARLYAVSNTHRIQIDIEGAGSGGTSIIVSNGAIPGNSEFNSYVSVKGPNRNLKLLVNDTTFAVVAGSVILSEMTLALNDDGATPIFQNFIFDDIDFDFHTGSLNFIGCKFKGVCNIKNTAGTISFSSCTGGYVICNKPIPATLRGEGDVPDADF